jgi:hypothetical protein
MRSFQIWLLAGLLLSIACCSDGGGGSGDDDGSSDSDSDTDSDSDSDTDDDEQVIVHRPNGTPIAGIDVVVHDSSGAVTAQATTDSDGIAPIQLSDGGGITAVWLEDTPAGPDYHAASVLGLAAGDQIRLIVDSYVDEQLAYMTLAFDYSDVGGDSWDVTASCRNDTTMYEADFPYDGCNGVDSYDVVVHYPGHLWEVFPAEPYQPGQTVSYVLNDSLAVDAPLVDFTATGVPAEATSFFGAIYGIRPEGGWNRHSRSTDVEGGAASVTTEAPYVASGGHYVMSFGPSCFGCVKNRVHVDTAPATAVWQDSDLKRVQFVGPPAGYPRPELSWELADAGHLADAVMVELAYDNPDPDNPVFDDRVYWSLWLPASAEGTATFPELPGDLSAWAPQSGEFESLSVTHVEVPDGDGLRDAVNAEFDHLTTITVLGG